MNIICFIGSGFNYMLADIIKSKGVYTKEDTPLHEEIIRLNKLWNLIEPLLSPFNNFFLTKHGEELLEAVDGFNTVYNKFIGIDTSDQTDTAAMFNARIKKEMQKVGEQFTKFELSGGYSLINAALPNLGGTIQESLNRKEIKSFYLCTTNYDGIIDTLFTYSCKVDQKRKFILKDGFINTRFNRALFEKANYKIAHIHGSYRYSSGSDGTRKLNRGIINKNPVMIYDDPKRKEQAIMNDPVLCANLLELRRQLSTCDMVISIGNSFRTEPHLIQLMRAHFNRPNTQMMICSDKPDEVIYALRPCYDYPIYIQSTEYINSEEKLIKLFEELLSSKRTSFLATA